MLFYGVLLKLEHDNGLLERVCNYYDVQEDGPGSSNTGFEF